MSKDEPNPQLPVVAPRSSLARTAARIAGNTVIVPVKQVAAAGKAGAAAPRPVDDEDDDWDDDDE